MLRNYEASVAMATIVLAAGTLLLALFTYKLSRVTVRVAKEDRKHDAEQRTQERAYNDKLRQEQRTLTEQQEKAGQALREDYNARQVIVRGQTSPRPGHSGLHACITLIAPRTYPVKLVSGCLVSFTNNLLTVTQSIAHNPYEDISADDNNIYYNFWTRIKTEDMRHAGPIMSFVDEHKNLYYQYRHYTRRFPQNTDFHEAATDIDQWLRLGPCDTK